MRSVILFRKLLPLLFLLCAASAFAQTPYLERPVTIKYGTQTYSEIFRSISTQTGVVFSYTTSFDSQRKITVQYAKSPLRIVLNDLFRENGCTYKLKGKYVIITCKAEKPKPAPDLRLSGYIYDAYDSTLLASSSVYIRQNKQSAVTNDYGYFSLTVPRGQDALAVSIAKEEYHDTTIVLRSKSQQTTITVYLRPKQQATVHADSTQITVIIDSVPQTAQLPANFKPPVPRRTNVLDRFTRTGSNMRNISDTFFTNYSFSFVPPLSTNRLLSVNTVNNYSLNLLAGYSKGINVMEIGGLANIDNGDVRWVQIGGLINLVSGSVTGVQVGGIANVTGSHTSGVQVGGIANVNRGNVEFLQIGGISNTVFGTFTGLQIGGIANVVSQKTTGMQLAGITNLAYKGVEGFQLAGIANITDTIRGFQLAGIANMANYIDGFQLAGIVNRAGYVKGGQLALINVADSVKGVPFGLISVVRNGYHKLELAADEQFIATFGVRTGVDLLHNIFFAGLQPTGSRKIWTVGYGLGSAMRMGRNLYLSFDVTGQQVQFTSTSDLRLNLLSKAYLGLEWRLAKKFSISAGPTFNLLTADEDGNDFALLKDHFNGRTLYDYSNGFYYNRIWVGARLSLKFL